MLCVLQPSHLSCNHACAMGKNSHWHRYAGAMELEKRLEERVTEFELSNGLHFIVMERHNAPIVSVHTYANVGAFDERDGQTGMDTARFILLHALQGHRIAWATSGIL